MIDSLIELNAVKPFDALFEKQIDFDYTGGSKQVVGNELIITDKSDESIVYDVVYNGYDFAHLIPANTLVNGKEYSIKIKIKFSDGTFSDESKSVTFKTFKKPVLDITTIDGDGYIYNSKVLFVVNYEQEQNEIVKWYKFRLYNESDKLIEEFPMQYSYNDNQLTQLIDGLERHNGYYLSCEIETMSGLKGTIKEHFIPLISTPSINGLISVDNEEQTNFVKVMSNVKSIGESDLHVVATQSTKDNIDNYQYVDNDMIVIPEDNPLLLNAVAVSDEYDFVLKLWFKDIPNNAEFLEIKSDDGNKNPIKFVKRSNSIVATKYLNGVVSNYTSNTINIKDGTTYMLYVKSSNFRLDLIVKEGDIS